MKKILLMFVSALTLFACSQQQSVKANEEDQENANKKEEKKRILVLYYSQTGATKTVANEIAKRLEADIDSIVPENPYDGDFQQTIDRCKDEMTENKIPAIKSLNANVSDYDVIFIGYPIWFGTFARPILGLNGKINLEGKEVVPFCTFGSGGLQSSTNDLKAMFPTANFKNGYGVRNARLVAMPNEIDRFLKENKFIEGEVEPFAQYSSQQPVTKEDCAIFDTACGNYQFPLGTPVSVGKRVTNRGTEYMFIANSKDANGNDTKSTIYIIVGTEDGAKAEFTEVVR